MLTIGILGGTGPQGRGLARRLASAGHPTVLGSRSSARASETAESVGVDGVTGGSNEDAAAADLVIVTVPYEGHADLLTALAEPLAGKIVVDCVNPLGFDAQGPYALAVADGSAAQEAQRILPDSTVVAAFHHLSAVRLEDPEIQDFDEDVLVLGEDRDAVGTVIELAAAALPGGRGVFAGRLRNAHQVEALTANLIAVNRRYKTHAGLRITDLP
ncbi:MAG TPA: NADPH-dependent F420 reductase [Microlunatus sp.]|nr:NADPH-dependent F420 reductase [Microlunatus sp.]